MQSVSFTELIDSLEAKSEGGRLVWSTTITENWMQGRTTYGGLSAALCLSAVHRQFTDLPELRTAQINFTGPVGGKISIECKELRRGKSVAYIEAVMNNEKGVATHAVFCCGAPRESRLNTVFADSPDMPTPEASTDFFEFESGPVFANNFDCRLAQGGLPVSGSKDNEHFIWIRHKDPKATDLAALLGIADMPPPAVLPMFTTPAPISSMTWMLNFANNHTTTRDGWWLMRTAGEYALDGYSSQDMQVWNRDGELVITGRQNVALFY